MKHLFITLSIQDGEREHTHRILHNTTGKNIDFAAERYASTYWGEGEGEIGHRGRILWWFWGEFTVRVESVVEISDDEYKVISDVFSRG